MKLMIPIRNDDLLRHLKGLLEATTDPQIHAWLAKELDGYMAEDELPWYRILECRQKGLFLHQATTKQQTCQINERCLGQRDMERIKYLLLRGPLSDYLNNHNKTLERWPQSLLHEYSRSLIPEHLCLYAWKEPLVCVRQHLLTGIDGLLQEYAPRLVAISGLHQMEESGFQGTETNPVDLDTAPQRSSRQMQHRQWWV